MRTLNADPVPCCDHTPCYPTSEGRPSTSELVHGYGARRGVRELAVEQMTALHTGVLIATFRRAAPARGGAFCDERRFDAGDGGGRVY
jgi:hypothetical protein